MSDFATHHTYDPAVNHQQFNNTTDINHAMKNAVDNTHQEALKTQHDFQGLHQSNNQELRSDQPLTHFHSFFYDLVTWKYPRATLLIFGGLMSTILAFRFVNVMRYVFKAAYILFGAVATLEAAGKPLGYRGLISGMRPRRYHTIPRENVESIFEELHDFLNFVVVEFQRIVYVENIFTTGCAFAASFVGYFLIKYLPFWSLALLTTMIAFTGPYFYLNNQEAIDAQINHYSDIANAKLTLARGQTERYAGEAANRARATASQLTEKVQTYTTRKSSVGGTTSPTSSPVANPAVNTATVTGTTHGQEQANYPNVHSVEFPAAPVEDPTPVTSFPQELRDPEYRQEIAY